LFVDSSGNVAIAQAPSNTASFTRSFNISALDASIALRGSSGGTYTDQGIFFAIDGVNYSQIYNDGVGQLIFRTGSGLSERLRITSAGNVGIGTTSPVATLHIENTAGGDLFYALGSNSDVFKISSDSSTINLDTRNTTGGLAFQIQGTEKARIDSSGRLLIGSSSSISTLVQPYLQIHGTGENAFISANRWSNDEFGTALILGKSRGGAVGTRGAVSNDDSLGEIIFAGDNGSSFSTGGSITCAVDGAVSGGGAGDMPSRMSFNTTPDGTQTPVERMRIDSGGRFLVGTSTNGGAGGLTIRPNFSAGAASLVFDRANTASTSTVISFENNDATVGTITHTNTATAYNTSSDYRLKENVVPLDGAIARLDQLPVHRFNFKADPDTVVDGFIAHEAQEVVPECVTGTKDEVDDDGNPVMQGIDQSKLVPLLTAALQEAIAKIEVLEQRLNDAGIN
jgi:hypothetical protein